MSLVAVDTDELRSRLSSLQDSIDVVLKDIGHLLEKIGRLKQESDDISSELVRRDPPR